MFKYAKDIFFNWFSITKLYELFAIASFIAVIITSLVAIDFYSQEAKINFFLKGPVHDVIKKRLVENFKRESLTIPKAIDLEKLFKEDVLYTHLAFYNEIPIDEHQDKLELIDSFGKSSSNLLRWVPVTSSIPDDNNLNDGKFDLSVDLAKNLGDISINEKSKILQIIVESTVSCEELMVMNEGNADATNVDIQLTSNYDNYPVLYSSYNTVGKLLRVHGLGDTVEVDKNSYIYKMGSLKKGQTKTIYIYTIGEPINKKSIEFIVNDKPKVDKKRAISNLIIAEIIILGLLFVFDIIRFILKGIYDKKTKNSDYIREMILKK